MGQPDEASFGDGERVQYFSSSAKKWIGATVVKRNSDGTYDLSVKRRAPLSSLRKPVIEGTSVASNAASAADAVNGKQREDRSVRKAESQNEASKLGPPKLKDEFAHIPADDEAKRRREQDRRRDADVLRAKCSSPPARKRPVLTARSRSRDRADPLPSVADLVDKKPRRVSRSRSRPRRSPDKPLRHCRSEEKMRLKSKSRDRGGHKAVDLDSRQKARKRSRSVKRLCSPSKDVRKRKRSRSRSRSLKRVREADRAGRDRNRERERDRPRERDRERRRSPLRRRDRSRSVRGRRASPMRRRPRSGSRGRRMVSRGVGARGAGYTRVTRDRGAVGAKREGDGKGTAKGVAPKAVVGRGTFLNSVKQQRAAATPGMLPGGPGMPIGLPPPPKPKPPKEEGQLVDASKPPKVSVPGVYGVEPEMYTEELWEMSREDRGLKLLGELLEEDAAKWQYVLMDESRRSFAAYRPSPFTTQQCREYFNIVKDGTDWKQPESKNGALLPRKTAWMVREPCICTYRYGSIEVDPQVYPPWMIELMGLAMPLCGITEKEHWPNCCNLNLYEDGGMSVGWHSDDEKLFQGKFQDIRILSLTFGVKRKFEIRTNWPAQGEQREWCIRLGDGDMCTMEGMMQKHYQHRIPKEGNIQGPRINLTWRWVVKHCPKCPSGRMRPGMPAGRSGPPRPRQVPPHPVGHLLGAPVPGAPLPTGLLPMMPLGMVDPFPVMAPVSMTGAAMAPPLGIPGVGLPPPLPVGVPIGGPFIGGELPQLS